MGSYASFSDLFRFALLSKVGGLWADTDVVALAKADDLEDEKFLVTERLTRGGGVKVTNNVIYSPAPVRGDVIDLAFAYGARFDHQKINWSEIGPDLLTAIVSIFPEHGYHLKRPDFANQIDYWDCPTRLLTPGVKLKKAAFLHLYNEMWRRAGVSKEQNYPEGSVMDALTKNAVLPVVSDTENLNPQWVLRQAFVQDIPRTSRPRPFVKPLAELLLTAGRYCGSSLLSGVGERLWRM